ncbi:MAG: hypothetical protein WC637_17950 [Victivallales bacterium]|jgi:hypothetical protein
MFKNNKFTKAHFTLIELMAAMGVFAIIMLVMLTFFSSAQKAWTNCINRGQIYENARIAMDLIARDLQCAYYEKDKVPFWHKGYTNYRAVALAYAAYDQEALCFVSATNVAPDGCKSKICEIKYQLYNYDPAIPTPNSGDPKLEGWLLRSVTGDAPFTGSTPNPKWNYYINATPWPAGAGRVVDRTALYASVVFSADSSSSEGYQKVIPHVTKLEYTCYYRGIPPAYRLDPDWITAHPDNIIIPDYVGDGSSGAVSPNNYEMTFPYSVRIELSLMDQQSWLKWKAMGGTRFIKFDANTTIDSGEEVDDVQATQIEFRKQNERTFVKTVILGERGQYDY